MPQHKCRACQRSRLDCEQHRPRYELTPKAWGYIANLYNRPRGGNAAWVRETSNG